MYYIIEHPQGGLLRLDGQFAHQPRDAETNMRSYSQREAEETLCDYVGPAEFRDECVIRRSPEPGQTEWPITMITVSDIEEV